MKVLVQRSKKSSVSVNNEIIGKIEKGMVCLVSFTHTDTEKEIDWMINKILNLRIFDDEFGIMNKSIKEIDGEILSISQFTLYANTEKGNRPSYINAMNGENANKLYTLFNEKLKQNIKVQTGKFGHVMELIITNDGPTTIMLEK